MVKRSLFWGQAAGKLGEAVYYRSGGEQRTRTYIKNIKNPRSQAQAITRAKLNNLTACFRGASIFVRSYFKPSKSNQSAFNAFVAANSAANRYVADNTMIKLLQGIPMGLEFSNGTSGDQVNFEPIEITPSNDPESSGKYLWGMPIYVPALTVTSQSFQASSGGIMVPDGKTLYQVFTAPENGFTLPAEFDLTFLIADGGGDGLFFTVATVHCSTTSTDTLHIVQKSPGVVTTDADIRQSLVIGGNFGEIATGGTTTPAMGQIGIGTPTPTEEELYFTACCVLSYTGANGKVWNAASLGTTQKITENYGDSTPDGETGKIIVAKYVGTQNTL